MSELVPADQIEQIVGARRHRKAHLGRAVSGEQTVYILHSHLCRDSGIDLRQCRFSRALDRGISVGADATAWSGHEDRLVLLGVWHDRLIPVKDLDDGDAGVELLRADQ